MNAKKHCTYIRWETCILLMRSVVSCALLGGAQIGMNSQLDPPKDVPLRHLNKSLQD